MNFEHSGPQHTVFYLEATGYPLVTQICKISVLVSFCVSYFTLLSVSSSSWKYDVFLLNFSQNHSLLPHFDHPIPATSKHCVWKSWMPNTTYGRTLLVCTILLQYPKSSVIGCFVCELKNVGRIKNSR